MKTLSIMAVGALLASAAVIGLLEEALVVGYLVTRMKDMQVSLPWIIAASALLRGGYSDEQIQGILGGNTVRLIRQVQALADPAAVKAALE